MLSACLLSKNNYNILKQQPNHTYRSDKEVADHA